MRPALCLRTATARLAFDAQTGGLCSLRAMAAPDQEFAIAENAYPACVVQFLDRTGRPGQISSLQASQTRVWIEPAAEDGPRGQVLRATFRRLDDLEVDVSMSVRAGPDDPFCHWSLTLCNGAGLQITDVQFPFIVTPYELAGQPGSEALLWPLGPGVLLPAPKPQDLAPDNPHTWQMRPENGDAYHYPGYTVAQFMAYYNDRAGIYLSCLDTTGRIKLIRPVHCDPGLRLGLAHVGDWPALGDRTLEYDIVLGTFQGDWVDAAEMYRSWSLQQPWAQVPLHARKDVPAWLLDSPPHIVVRIQGELDIGPTTPKEEFLPYPKLLPLLDTVAADLEAPVVPVLMSWERPGPWIYPDCFPPVGGSASLCEFTGAARERGWHIGTFCNGTRWVVGHYWSGYDGDDYLREHGGEQSICRTPQGELWRESWDATWRPSFTCCLGVPMTREIAIRFMQTCLDLGLDWIQFFDQNIGACAFPCFAADHGHPPVPGSWMTGGMRELLDAFHGLMEEAGRKGDRSIALSVEGPANEYFMPDFHICDIRVVPPGHNADGLPFVPLYHYLYHEFILIQGGFGTGPEPYHMPIRSAYNLVVGEIPGAVLKGDGQLLNADTWNWAPWSPQIGDNGAAMGMLKATVALRRGAGRDFLVYGRMVRPANLEGVATMRWQHGGRDHHIPAIFHAAWLAPNGRLGLVLANWTTEAQVAHVRDERFRRLANLSLSTPAQLASSVPHSEGTGIAVELPPLSCALLH